MIEAAKDAHDNDGIWHINLAALEAFLAVSTQWRFATPGDGSLHRLGLDYASVRVGFDLAGIAMTPELWRDVQIIEYGAMAASADEASA